MGLYANPNLRGIGNILLKLIIKYSFETLKVDKILAEVFCENQKAYNLYLKSGFKKLGVKEINDREVFCMELNKNENR
jgi:UDP-4-amino-4,6-dideoxy-N-acetyl-beta-L-altrosamine N-acetyltransferase